MLAAGGSALPRDDALRLLSLADLAREADPARWTPYHETTRLLLRALYGDDDVGQAVDCARSRARRRARGRRPARGRRAVAARLLAAAGRRAGGRRARAGDDRPPARRGEPVRAVGALATRALAAVLDGRPRVAATFAERALRARPSAPGSRRASRPRCANFALALVALLDEPAGRRRARAAARAHDPPAIECGALHAWLTAALAEISAARGRLARRRARAGRGARAAGGLRRRGPRGRVRRRRGASGCATLRAGAATPLEPLSKAEMAVLRLFDQDRSARAIGAELYLSHNTVKTHIRAIYRKLGVGTREDALARGEALGSSALGVEQDRVGVARRALVALALLRQRRQLDRRRQHVLVVDRAQQVADAGQPRAPLVVALDRVPRAPRACACAGTSRPWRASSRPSGRATRCPSGSASSA